MLVRTKKEAIARGDRYYFTGVSCKHGHVANRRTGNGDCVECVLARALDWAKKNPEKAAKNKSNWVKSNPEKALASGAEYRKNNPEKEKIRGANYRNNNIEKEISRCANYRENNREKVRAVGVNYRENNPEKVQANGVKWRKSNRKIALIRSAVCRKNNPVPNRVSASKRRAAKLNRTPAWLTKDDHECMVNIYKIAARVSRETGIDHHVDHKIPLQGGLVSGLHVPDNLQLLTAFDNISKNNHFDTGDASCQR